MVPLLSNYLAFDRVELLWRASSLPPETTPSSDTSPPSSRTRSLSPSPFVKVDGLDAYSLDSPADPELLGVDGRAETILFSVLPYLKQKYWIGSGKSCNVFRIPWHVSYYEFPICVKVYRKFLKADRAIDEYLKLRQFESVDGVVHAVAVCMRPPALVMTRHGRSLDQFFGSHPYPSDDTIMTVLIKTINVIMNLHAHGFAHNDIKLDNVAIEIKPQKGVVVTLLDMELAGKIGDKLPRAFRQFHCHSQHYKNLKLDEFYWIAPELFNAGSTMTTEADVFSVSNLLLDAFEYMDRLPATIIKRLFSGLESDPRLRPSLSKIRDWLIIDLFIRRGKIPSKEELAEITCQ